ncbi:MAG: S8 family peptidase [Saprospiraceae bacterium]|nr:S8 family peptidase [Saprospiraceae bacterium]
MNYIFFNIKLIAFFYFMTSFIIYGQIIDHKLGEFIVKLKQDVPIQEFLESKSNFKKNNFNLEIKQCVSHEWNIWLLKNDFTKYNEFNVLNALNKDNTIVAAQFNHILHYRVKPNDKQYSDQWYHYNILNSTIDMDSEEAWDAITGGVNELGDTIAICVIDGGIDFEHEEFQANIWRNSMEIAGNLLDDDKNGYIDDVFGWNTFSQSDQHSKDLHGTSVSGLAAARGNNNIGITSNSWNTKLVFVTGGSDEANAIESYTYPWKLRKTYNETNGTAGAFIVAVNSSWGRNNGKPDEAPLWCAVYDSLGNAGIVSVAATANQSTNVDIYGDLPTSCPSDYLLTVTNINEFNQLVNDAAYGKNSIDIGAYGENVITTILDNKYRTVSGTSYASPQVLSAIALVYAMPCNRLSDLSKSNPPLAALEVKDIILKGVRYNASIYNKTVSGGVLNLNNAVLLSSPLQLLAIEKTEASFIFNSKLLSYPIIFQYKKLNDSMWTEIEINDNKAFKISNLESCTEYNYRFKGACPRFINNYSQIERFKTKNCCEAISRIHATIISSDNIKIQFENNSSGDTTLCLVKPASSITWDTIQFLNLANEITLKHLYPCNIYDLKFISSCINSDIKIESESIQIINSNCLNCSLSNICLRRKMLSSLEWIESIEVNSLKHTSGNNDGYGNFIATNKSWNLIKNQLNNFRLTAGYDSDTSLLSLAVYIDFNQDGILDNELINTSNLDTFRSIINFNFMIPSIAKTGKCRMRVIARYAEFNHSTPAMCSSIADFGEFEDYCINILESPCDTETEAIISSITENTCSVQTKPNLDIVYRYRENFSPFWSNPIIGKNLISLQNLRECTKYELELASICANEINPLKLYFKTKGSTCETLVNNEHQNKIEVFPNPTKNIFEIHNNNLEVKEINVYNINGKLCISNLGGFTERIIVNSNLLTPGIYFVVIKLKNGISKIIKVSKL